MSNLPDVRSPSFDYIIVGAGSSGCVLANRLTADGKNSVLLVEAGGDDRPMRSGTQVIPTSLIHVPAGVVAAMRSPGITWGFLSEPEPGVDGRRFDVIRGRVLGGSSSVNGMLYVRGEKEDYDGWANAGCTGWNWDAVLPYFRRAENHEVATFEWRGTEGPLHVSASRPFPIMETVLDAAASLGLPRAPAFDGGVQFGGGYTQLNIHNGRRQSAAKAYLHEAMKRRNLTVATNNLVTRLLFEERNAVGVEVRRAGQLHRYRANKEVIVAAGAIGSPHLLELSGIGDGARLKSLGIPVLIDRPAVGENLQDHYYVPISWRLNQGIRTINDRARFPGVLAEVFKYLFTRRGLLGESAVQLFIYAKSRPDVPTADLQLSVVPATMPRFIPGGRMVPDPFPGMMIASCPLRPMSRGHVHAQSSDVAAHPSIQHRYLCDPIDQAAHVAGLRLARAIVQHNGLAQHVQGELMPGADARSDEDLLAYARREGSTVYHPVGTVRMGSDEEAPLDPQLRVRGTRRLRVVDASVMPFLTSGNTHAPTVMIAEKASDLILSTGAVDRVGG